MKCSTREIVKANFVCLRQKRFDMMMWYQACWFGRSIKTITHFTLHCYGIRVGLGIPQITHAWPWVSHRAAWARIYPFYPALLSDWLVSDSPPLAYLRERTCELAIGAFLHCKDSKDLLRVLGLLVWRKLGNRWNWKGESWFYYTKVLFAGVVAIAEMWFYLV